MNVVCSTPARVEPIPFARATVYSPPGGGGPVWVYASVVDTTAIGDLSLLPTPQAKSVMPSQTVDYGLTLRNFATTETYDDLPPIPVHVLALD